MVITGDRAHHPALLALFSIVTVVLISSKSSIRLSCQKQLGIRRHYRRLPMRYVRQQLWQMQTFQMSSADVDTVKVPRALQHLV